jgi:hypothetical protein
MSDLHITPYACPMPGCVGGLIATISGDTDRCLHCAGTGLTADPMGGADRAPRPPSVMRTACADCAFRQGSPELENAGVQLPDDEPFFCHQGLPIDASGRYQPVAVFRGLPLGAMVCAGWWALRTGEQLPAQPYREIPIGEDGVDRIWGAQAVRNLDRAVAAHRPAAEPIEETETPVTDTDPIAEELRAAHAKITGRLADPELTQGPWLSLDHGDRLLRDQPGDEDNAPIYVVNEPMTNGANSHWIELMHPGVGRVIADLVAERLWIAENDPGAFGTTTDTAALNLARLINERP